MLDRLRKAARTITIPKEDRGNPQAEFLHDRKAWEEYKAHPAAYVAAKSRGGRKVHLGVMDRDRVRISADCGIRVDDGEVLIRHEGHPDTWLALRQQVRQDALAASLDICRSCLNA